MAQEESMKWIKTSDQLPENGQYVLFLNGFRFRVRSAGIFVLERNPPYFCTTSGVGFGVDSVLYWMPYPELPKEETNER